MEPSQSVPKRFIGLDIHKHYLVAYGVDADLNQVLGPRRVGYAELERSIGSSLTKEDALVIEMTTNAWKMRDLLLPHVHSVTVVHPPHVALITRSQVMNDRMRPASWPRCSPKGCWWASGFHPKKCVTAGL